MIKKASFVHSNFIDTAPCCSGQYIFVIIKAVHKKLWLTVASAMKALRNQSAEADEIDVILSFWMTSNKLYRWCLTVSKFLVHQPFSRLEIIA